MNYFLGLDLSLTASGYCIINQKGKRVSSGIVRTEATGNEIKSRFGRYRYISKQILSKVSPYIKNLKTIAIETASYGSKGSGKIQLIEASAVVTNDIIKEDTFDVIEVAPISLKKFIIGSIKAKGKESKNIMCREVYIKYNETINDDNEVDAFALSQVALVHWKISNDKDYDGNLFKYQYEVVNNIIKKRYKDLKNF